MSELLKNILGLVNPVGAQREQINLLSLEKSQLVSLVGEMQSEITNLGSKVSVLETENTNLKKEIQRRDDIVQKEKSHGSRLEEVKEKILLFVANNQDAVDQQIAHAVGVGVTVVSFHLEELRKAKMVSDSHIMGSDWSGEASRTEWAIAHAGRGYLISHGLIA